MGWGEPSEGHDCSLGAGDWLRSARGIGFARRRGIGFAPRRAALPGPLSPGGGGLVRGPRAEVIPEAPPHPNPPPPGGWDQTPDRRHRRLASVGAGDWLRSAPAIGFGPRRRLASVRAGDWLRSAPAIGFGPRRGLASVRAGDWLRSAPGIGFARRKRVGSLGAGAWGVAGAVADLAAPAAGDRGRPTGGRTRNRERYPLRGVPLDSGGFGRPRAGCRAATRSTERTRPRRRANPGVRLRSQSCGSVRIGRRRRLARPCGLAPRRRRTNPSRGAERTRALTFPTDSGRSNPPA